MAKKRKGKSSLIPMLAIGLGIYLLTRNKAQVPPVLPPLPPPGNTVPGDVVIQRIWPRRMPQYV